jgi:hypothetical protein
MDQNEILADPGGGPIITVVRALDEAKAAFQAAGERRRPRFSRQWAVCGE